ncbi:protein SnodProt1 [Parachaetomium inaequale]|uniref:Protein SnodProt1 n=1 Tax=Parachaetomium inaequale TaxID=2588326 RepID=A0AAN6PPM1_9PEZI|nr:protein SnodProt1 [Parachaetomium inaequale]
MQFSKILSIFSLAAAASATTVSYDVGYDDGNRPLTSVACSDGTNGLIWRYNWNYQRDVARFPYIGGAQAIGGWNSPSCGSCWSATYNGRTIHILAIDHAASGLNMGLTAMNDLTNGHAVELGRIEATVQQVDLSNCGL